MQGVESASPYTIAESEAAELAGLGVRQGIGSGTALYSLILGIIGFIVAVGTAAHNRSLKRPRVANLKIQDPCDFSSRRRSAWCASAEQAGTFEKCLRILHTAGKTTPAAVKVRQSLVDLFCF